MEHPPTRIPTGIIYSFTEYFLKSRDKPGHVDALTALDAVSNPILREIQRIADERRLCVIGRSPKHPGKYIRVILLGDAAHSNIIHNAFLDRGAAKRIGRNS